MRVLLDECIPRKLKYSLLDQECQTVPEAGLAGKKNGTLLKLAESAGFEIFVTMDKGLEYEQNLAGRSIALLILRAKSNRWCVFWAVTRISGTHAARFCDPDLPGPIPII
jgi:hypothetical protein